jgi:hypothetical protein
VRPRTRAAVHCGRRQDFNEKLKAIRRTKGIINLTPATGETAAANTLPSIVENVPQFMAAIEEEIGAATSPAT